ncbi:MAG: DUF3014 domain-containing protein [Candidatus Aminicenantes bacterium]|nr:DUF3014 domain-containing protein [Candidatus Aminicenantes bacterium]
MTSYKVIIIVSIILVLLVTALYINFFVIPKKSEPQKQLTPTHKENIPAHPPTSVKQKSLSPMPALPALNESDDFIREYLKTYSSQAIFQKWLKPKDILRRFVAIVDNIARGEIPSTSLTFLNPDKPFKVIKKTNHITLDPENYRRYDLLINIFVSLDTGALMVLYDKLRPLLEEAYKELGYPEKQFNDTLLQALRVVMDTPIIQSPVSLEKQVITYSFKDPRLEALTPAQKQIFRTGPENIRRIKKKCREISRELNFEKR